MDDDNLYLGAKGAAPAGLVVAAGAVFNITNTANGGIADSNAATGATPNEIFNAGLLESNNQYNSGDYYAPNDIGSFIDSTGTILSNSGDLVFDDAGTLGGLLAGAGEIDLYGNYVLTSNVVIDVGNLYIGNSGTVVLNASENYTGFFGLGFGGGGNLNLNGNNLTLTGASTLGNGSSAIYGPGTVTVTGPATVNNLGLSNGAVLVDAGTIIQTGALQLPQDATSASLIIDRGAVYIIEDINGQATEIGAGGAGTILNAGLIALTGYQDVVGEVVSIAPNVTNSGTISDLVGGALTFAGSLDNDGLITISGSVAITDPEFVIDGALYADTGKTGTIVLGADGALDVEGPVAANETFIITAGGTVGPELSIGDLSQFAGTITGFASGSYIDLENVLANGFSYANNILTLTEAQNGGAATIVDTLALIGVVGTLGLIDDGSGGTSIVLNNPGPNYSNPAGNTSTKTWNNSNAAWTTAGDWSPSGVPGASNIAIINAGAVSFNTTDTVYQLNESGSAKLAISGGKLTVDDGGTSQGSLQISGGTFDAATAYYLEGQESLGSSGTLEIDTGPLLFIGATAVLAGTILGNYGGGGWVNFASGNITLNPGFVFDAPFGYITGANVTLGSSVSIAAPFDLYSGSLNLNSHSFTLSGTSVLGEGDSTFDIQGTGSVVITGTAQISDVELLKNVELIDSGVITQETFFYIGGGGGTDKSSISIASTGIYNFADNGAANILEIDGSGSVVNTGLFEMTGFGNDTNALMSSIVNTGTLLAAEGTLQLQDGGTLSGTLAGAGAIDLEGGTFTIGSSLTVTVADFEISYGDETLALTGHTLVLGNTSYDDGVVAGTGDFKITGTGYANGLSLFNKSMLEDAGTVVLTGNIELGSSPSDTSSILIDAGATFALSGQGEGPSINAAASQTVTNNGLLETTGFFTANEYSSLTDYLNNSGTVLVNGTDLQINDGGTLGGTLAGTGEIDLGGTFDLASGLLASIATLNIESSDITLSSNLIYAGGFVSNGGTINLAGNSLTLAQTTLSGSTQIFGSGTVLVVGTAQIDSLELAAHATLEDAGTIIQSDYLYLGVTSGDVATLKIDTGAIYDASESGSGNAILNEAENTGGDIINAGLLESNNLLGYNNLAYDLTNTGTVAAQTSEFDIFNVTNLNAAGTLTSGSWEAIGAASNAGTLVFEDGSLSTDAANLIFSGAGSEILAAGGSDTVEFDLTSITSAGTLQNLAGRNYATANNISDAGSIVLGGGTFAPAALSIAATGSLSGFGTVSAPIINNGEIIAAGGLTLAGGISGTGTLLTSFQSDLTLAGGIAAGETIGFNGALSTLTLESPATMAATLSGFAASEVIDIASTIATAVSTSGDNLLVSFAGGGVLDYALAAPIAAGLRFGLSPDGGSGTDIKLYREAAAAAVAPNPVNFGQHHVGDALSAALTIANVQPADGASEALDASFAGATSGITAAGSISLLAAGATNSTSLDIGVLTNAAGSIGGNAVIALFSDGTGTDGDAPVSIGTQTVAVTGTLFNYATAKTAATINFGEHHAGTSTTKYITISNTAAAGAFSENLDASFTSSSTGFTGAGSVTTLAAGSTSSTKLDLTLNSKAGLDTGSTTLALTSDGSGIDSLSTTSLANITIATVGTLFNYATAAVTPKPLSFGQHHVGDVITQFVTIANTAAPGAYSEKLDASFSGTSAHLTGAGSLTHLAAGGTNSSSLAVTLASAIAGVETGNATIKLTSDTAGIDTLSNTGLTSQTVTVSGTLFNYATATAATPAPVDLGIIHVGSTFGEYLTFSNAGAVGKYTENLDGSFTGTSSNIIASGTLSELAAGSTTKGSLKLQVNTGSAGTITGTTTLALTSDGRGIDSLGTTALAGQIITVIGTVNNYATIGVETIAGAGTLTGTGTGTTLHLNLGSTTAGSAALSENIGVLNNTAGPSDLLSGSFSLTGSTLYNNTSFGSFSSLTAGSADANPTISLGTDTIGTFQETIVVHGTGSNASGYSAAVGSETIIVVGTITAAPMAFVAAATPSTATPAATPMTGSDAAKSYALKAPVSSAASFTSASPDVTTATASTVSLGAYTSTDLLTTSNHPNLHAAIIAGLG